MGQFNLSEKKDLVYICLIYRYISLAISTLVYFYMYNWQITHLRGYIAMGIILASVIGSLLYKASFADKAGADTIITMCLEIVAFGLFLVFSGGFASPYLWYFISASTIVIAVGCSRKFFRVLTVVALVWYFLCALAGEHYGLVPGYRAYSSINIGIAFLVVAGGFYVMFIYADRLNQSRQQMNRLNQSLQNETLRSEQALRHTMDTYEFFNLFSITDPGKVMDEIASLLFRTIAPGGCLLLKISILREIESIAASGLTENQVEHVIDYFVDHNLTSRQEAQPIRVEIQGQNYDMFYIRKLVGTQGVLFRLCPSKHYDSACEEGDKAQETFYLNLVGIIMKELELQAMAEAYIVSDEQNRIASEIHDTVIQKLFSIACNLRMLEEAPPSDETSYRGQLKNIARAVESTMRELREAIYGLRWEAGGANPFADKLSIYMDELRCLSGADISITICGDAQLMTSTQKTIFYRIICEAANNAIRHGKATEVNIQISVDDERLQSTIRDNGNGFDQRQLPAGGQGLKNMCRMANMLKGQLLIESAMEQGSIINCILPR